ncbi:MAG: hypothetical protein ACR2GY_13060 [Phycisphaerales bacterium]
MTDDGNAAAGDRAQRILLVGHCGPDAFMLRNAVARISPGVAIEMVNEQEAVDAAGRDDVLLVNRVLDGDFPSESGIDLIRRRGSDAAASPAMLLVSNIASAQAEAEAAGAQPGFGKVDLFAAETAERLRAAMRRR